MDIEVLFVCYLKQITIHLNIHILYFHQESPAVMAFNLLRMGQRRLISTTARCRFMDRVYQDRVEYPAPRVRFVDDAELSGEMKALRQKEAGDWKALSVAEKQQCKQGRVTTK